MPSCIVKYTHIFDVTASHERFHNYPDIGIRHGKYPATGETPERYVFKRDMADETPERYVLRGQTKHRSVMSLRVIE